MWDALLVDCQQTKLICAKETVNVMAYLETIKARPRPKMAATLPTIENPTPPLSLMQLVDVINATVDRSGRAAERSKKLDISAGLSLIQAKKLFQEVPVAKRVADERTWDAFCDKYFEWGRSRVNELISIVDGRITEEEAREAKRISMRLSRERKQQHGLKSPPRGGDLDEDSDDIEADIDPDPDTRRLAFMLRADQARLFAKYTGPIDEDVLRIAREALAAWTLLVQQLTQEVSYAEN